MVGPLIAEAIESLRKGEFVMIFDSKSREGEVDLVIHAESIDTDKIYFMRNFGGGLICFAMPKRVASILRIDFFTNYIKKFQELSALLKKPKYGDEPAFSIWVNHINVDTGIRDYDRALTIRELAYVVRLAIEGKNRDALEYFYTHFYSPGHVPILIGRSIRERRGHTEISLYLAALAGIYPAIALVEMLKKGGVVSFEEAMKISKELGIPLITSYEVVSEVLRHGEDMYCRYHLC